MRARVTTGWWCAFTVRMPLGGAGGEWVRVHACATRTPERALVWMRLSVRTRLSTFDTADANRTYRWLDHGQWEAVIRLKTGEPYTFAASAGDTRIEWSVRPVRFLPRVDQHPTEGRPSCGGLEW
ncbi:hypothetical protein ABCR94_07220 [Streptomyces sp. 21So2-11]|uniref:hypothetical protein n=1 Tax=Streptomyces sp. 21So2-11 TaxID=3144408 RepID=UPI00321B53B3